MLGQAQVNQIVGVVLILMRVGVFSMVVPILGDRLIPEPVRILMSLTLSIYLAAVHPVSQSVLRFCDLSFQNLIVTCVAEMAIGLLLGFCIKWIFDALMASGNLMGNWMGFASANTFDPHQEAHSDVVAKLLSALSTLFFLQTGLLTIFLRLCEKSLAWLPTGGFFLDRALLGVGIDAAGDLIKNAVLFSAPIAAIMLLMNLAFGLLGRAMPQLNSYSLSPIACMLVGMLTLLADQNELFAALEEMLQGVPEKFWKTLELLGGHRSV
jgi:flagellar biosynthetic protein FliR